MVMVVCALCGVKKKRLIHFIGRDSHTWGERIEEAKGKGKGNGGDTNAHNRIKQHKGRARCIVLH